MPSGGIRATGRSKKSSQKKVGGKKRKKKRGKQVRTSYRPPEYRKGWRRRGGLQRMRSAPAGPHWPPVADTRQDHTHARARGHTHTHTHTHQDNTDINSCTQKLELRHFSSVFDFKLSGTKHTQKRSFHDKTNAFANTKSCLVLSHRLVCLVI